MKPDANRDYTNLNREAKKMGFKRLPKNEGFFTHPDFDRIFDFTSTDPNKIMLAVYLIAKKDGKKELINTLNEAI